MVVRRHYYTFENAAIELGFALAAFACGLFDAPVWLTALAAISMLAYWTVTRNSVLNRLRGATWATVITLGFVAEQFEREPGVQRAQRLAVVAQDARLGAESLFVRNHLDQPEAPVFPAVRLRLALHHHRHVDGGARCSRRNIGGVLHRAAV